MVTETLASRATDCHVLRPRKPLTCTDAHDAELNVRAGRALFGVQLPPRAPARDSNAAGQRPAAFAYVDPTRPRGHGRSTGPTNSWTQDLESATIVVMSTQSLRDVRDHLSEVIDRVEQQHDRVVVTRNGVPAAVILSPEDLAQLEETIDVLGDSQALADIREADAAYERGDVVRGVDAVRALRP